jgi:hypothetical protein
MVHVPLGHSALVLQICALPRLEGQVGPVWQVMLKAVIDVAARQQI